MGQLVLCPVTVCVCVCVFVCWDCLAEMCIHCVYFTLIVSLSKQLYLELGRSSLEKEKAIDPLPSKIRL